MTDNRKYHYIYKTVNLINSNFYIGMHSTNNIKDGYMGSGNKIKSSIRHYGKNNHKFEILEFLDSRDLLMAREKEIVNRELLTDPLCLNIMEGGYGFLDEEHMKKVCKAGNDAYREKLKDPGYKQNLAFKCDWSGKGKHMLNVLNERGLDFGDCFRGKSHTSDSKSAIGKGNSISQLGDKNSQSGRKWVRNLITKECIKIDSSEFENYINLGWESGSFPSVSYCKLIESQVIEIKTMLSENIKTKEIANLFDVSITAIAKIKRGETYSHINFKIN